MRYFRFLNIKETSILAANFCNCTILFRSSFLDKSVLTCNVSLPDYEKNKGELKKSAAEQILDYLALTTLKLF